MCRDLLKKSINVKMITALMQIAALAILCFVSIAFSIRSVSVETAVSASLKLVAYQLV